ncbi:hypothetical protein CW713_05800 [Methanophagales archaeon]|nr:MAG: hypothetical protein CW714_09035 [Methanophagales archaeon]RJS81894.1 MAG: hypothetical protein CW713_05800 [Methanophagales archaeon]
MDGCRIQDIGLTLICILHLEFIPKAKRLLSTHPKDVPYLALALKFNCPIFSGDKTLKRLSPVKVLSPKEVSKLLIL